MSIKKLMFKVHICMLTYIYTSTHVLLCNGHGVFVIVVVVVVVVVAVVVAIRVSWKLVTISMSTLFLL